MCRHMLGLQHQVEGYIHTVTANKTQDINSKTCVKSLDHRMVMCRHLFGLQHQIEGYIQTVAADKTQDIYS